MTAFSIPGNELKLHLKPLLHFSHATEGERNDDVGEAAQPGQQD
jgi:hypothetical protein